MPTLCVQLSANQMISESGHLASEIIYVLTKSHISMAFQVFLSINLRFFLWYR